MDTINSMITTGLGAGEVEIRVHKGASAVFTVPNGPRPEIENAIANRLELTRRASLDRRPRRHQRGRYLSKQCVETAQAVFCR